MADDGGSWRMQASAAGGADSLVDALRATELFRSFTDTGLNIMAGIAHQKRLPLGTPLFVEQMLGEALFVILSGHVRVSVRGPDGVERTLTILGPGDTLGEAAILRAGPRMCSAIAQSDVVVVEIGRRDIASLQKTKPQACLKLMMSVVELLGQRLQGVDPELRQLVAWYSEG